MTTKPNKPVHTIPRYNLKLAIWQNGGEKGPWYSMTSSRRYKQGEEYKNASGFNADDMLPLAKMLDDGDSWMMQRQADRQAV